MNKEWDRMQNLPKISVIMPVLNRENTIEKALRSIINQQYPHLELIVLDGGSTDNTLNLIKRYENYISFWHSKPDKGPIDASNIGIKRATGDLIAFLMADDWYEKETLQKVALAYLKNPSVDMLTCAGRIVSFNKKKNQYEPFLIYDKPRQLKLTFYDIFFGCPAICCRFIKKSFYERIGLFLPHDKAGKPMLSSDKEFLLRAVLHGVSDVFIPYLGHTYLSHSDSSTFGHNQKNILRLCEEHLEIAENYLKREDLSQKKKIFLHYLYNDQATRLILYHLLAGKFQLAWCRIKTTFKKYAFMSVILFCYIFCRISLKRSIRFFLRVRSNNQ